MIAQLNAGPLLNFQATSELVKSKFNCNQPEDESMQWIEEVLLVVGKEHTKHVVYRWGALLFQLTRIISVVSSTHSKIKAPTLPPSVIHHHRVFNRAAKFNRIIHQPEETNLPGWDPWATVSELQFLLHPSYADVRAHRNIKQCKGDTYVCPLTRDITLHNITMHYKFYGSFKNPNIL